MPPLLIYLRIRASLRIPQKPIAGLLNDKMTLKSLRTIGTDGTRIPINLPPPYTWSGARSWQSRYVRKGVTSPAPLTPNRVDPPDFIATSTLLVGPKPTPFLIHTSLLTTQSPYFRAALTGPFLESKSYTITLDDIDVSHFQLLTTWLYTGSLPPPFKDGRPAYYTLLHVYALADRLCFEGLRNAVTDVMSDLADRTNSVLTPSDTRVLYDGIREGAKLRGLVLDLFGFKKTDRLLESHADEWHAAFLRDLVVQLKRPVPQAMARHRLAMWFPATWLSTRACDNCRTVLPLRYGAVACEDCCLAFCTKCVEGGVGMAGWEDGRGKWEAVEDREASASMGEATEGGAGEGTKAWRARKWESCKPWRGARCVLYHEHDETVRCGDIFLGR